MTPSVHNFYELRPRIIVMGVGGAGGNAVNNMIASGLEGVEFVAANTDAQALSMSGADMRFQMGVNLTEGLGAGSNPEIGEGAAEEVLEEMKELLVGAHMVFIACGMGGGTGTGAAPVIARVAQEMGVLTVAVVTKPFHFEGQRRMRVADAGIEQLRKYVDTMIVIPNQNLFRLANEQTTFADSFRLADQVLNSGVACVTDLIMKEGLINLDFADVKTVITEMGAAVMGTGMAHGEGRAKKAAEAAISNPLIDDISLAGAKGLLISISGGPDMTLFEVDEVASRIRSEVDPDANIIVGATFDDQLEGHIRVSLVASGLNHAHPPSMHEEADRRRMEVDLERERQQNPHQPGLQDRLQELEQKSPPVPGGRLTPHGRGGLPAGGPGQMPERGAKAPDAGAQSKGKVQIVNKPPRFITDGVEGGAGDMPLARGEVYEGEAPVSGKDFVPRAPQTTQRQLRRMPDMEELPVTGQKQLRAYEAPASSHGIEAQKKKVGFFERITGRGKREEPVPPSREAGQLAEPPLQPPAPSPVVPAPVPREAAYRAEMPGEPIAERQDEAATHEMPQKERQGGGEPQFDPALSRHEQAFGRDEAARGAGGEHRAGYDAAARPPQSHVPGRAEIDAHEAYHRGPEGHRPDGRPDGRAEERHPRRGDAVPEARRHDGFDEVSHQGHSEGYVSGVQPNPYVAPAQQERAPGQPPQDAGEARQGRAPAERYPTIEINKTPGLEGGLPGDDEDDPIGDIPPFLRKTTQTR